MANDPSGSVAIPQWHVTSQAERSIIDQSGAPVNVMTVTFQLADGTVGSVNVPLTAYTPDNVRAAIAAKAATLDAVNNLTS